MDILDIVYIIFSIALIIFVSLWITLIMDIRQGYKEENPKEYNRKRILFYITGFFLVFIDSLYLIINWQ